MSDTGLKIVFGAANFGLGDAGAEVNEYLAILEAGGVKTLDTATFYGNSEELLGKANAGKRFIIDTKQRGGFSEEGPTKANVIVDAKKSKELLGTNVDVWYIHSPGHDKVPIEEMVEGVKEVWESGFFKRFGLSNYKPEDVQKVYDACKKAGVPTPTVYQGNYNPVARHYDQTLFPLLRKLGISFYAYSPLAGGFLVKTRAELEAGGEGRWDANTMLGKLYRKLYLKPSYLDALEKWEGVAREEGVTTAELAYRWVKYSSPLKVEYGDALIIGASRQSQLKETLASINAGPLSSKAVKAIDGVWESVKHEAITDNFHG